MSIDGETAILAGVGLVVVGSLGYLIYDTAEESTDYENSSILGPAGTSSASSTPGGVVGNEDIYTGSNPPPVSTNIDAGNWAATGGSGTPDATGQITSAVMWASAAVIAVGATFLLTPIIAEFMLTREASREGARSAR
jgi:hypothetical protein